MARAPLLQLTDIALTFGGAPLFSDLSLVVQPGDRVALVGRNGSGKSTLMKVMAGLVEPDRGARVVSPGVSVGYMEQHPEMAGFATLGDFAMSDLDAGEMYRVEMAGEGLKFDPARPVATASGGERRRAALAKLMAEAPELMLLDEPTNHLDIEAIGWLEAQLKATRKGFVLISHDRAFLRELSRATLWIDRGMTRRQERGFAHFEEWRDKVWEEEDQQRHKLDRKIKAEARWAVEGISARRKRNQGRVRNLQALREERRAQIKRQGTAAMALESGPFRPKGDRGDGNFKGLRGSSDPATVQPAGHAGRAGGLCRAQRGGQDDAAQNADGRGGARQRHGGAWHQPDAGGVRSGAAKLDPDMTLWDSLTGDRGDARLGAGGSGAGARAAAPRGGLSADFLFDERQVRAPVKSLSGGEKARLLLAK